MPDVIYGISSQFNDYQLAWEINNLLDIELSKSKSEYSDERLNDTTDEILLYSYRESDGDYFYLLKNKYSGINLFPKLTKFDYLFIVEKKMQELSILLTQNSSSNIILACFKIDLTQSQLNIIKRILLK